MCCLGDLLLLSQVYLWAFVCVRGVNTTAKHGISKHGLVVRVENVQREQRALVSLYMVLSTSHKTDSYVFNYV